MTWLMSSAYTIEPRNKFMEAGASVAESEIHPGRTVTFLHEVDLTEAVRLRAQRLRKPSFTAIVVKAVAKALREFPYANRRVIQWPLLGRRIQRFHRCDVSVAYERDVPGAPMTSFIDTVRDADQQSLEALTGWLWDLARCDVLNNRQWRTFHTIVTRLPCWLTRILNYLPCFVPSLWVKYRGGAVMVSSPAKYGVDIVAATWTSPLGVSFGLVKDRPVVRDGRVVPCPTFVLTLNFDRRVMAGAQAARFFHRLVEILENAERELTGPGGPATACATTSPTGEARKPSSCVLEPGEPPISPVGALDGLSSHLVIGHGEGAILETGDRSTKN